MKWLITGGAGFIGSSAASRLMREGQEVVIVDNLSRAGARSNLAWLSEQGSPAFELVDIRDASILEELFARHRDVDVVLHLAAQVAVTKSVTNPRADFEVNALGTFNLCEAVRKRVPGAILLNASTNKVYGGMEDVPVEVRDGRYAYRDLPRGVSEARQLEFHSPYGCSKGAAEQYVCDYARIYGLRTVNFRQSCIYGPRQFGDRGPGLVGVVRHLRGAGPAGHHLWRRDAGPRRACGRRPHRLLPTCGGDHRPGLRPELQHWGRSERTLSLLELLDLLEEMVGRKPPHRFADWRPGDQRVFVCDITQARRLLGWEPKTPVREGVGALTSWVMANGTLLRQAA